MRWKPNVTVAAVIPHADRFLVVEEVIDGHPVINQPAGHLEPGESLLQAIVREVREETARDFRARHLVGVYRWRHSASDTTFLRFCFSGEVAERDTTLALDPVIRANHWLTREQLSARALRSPQVLRAVDDYLAGERYPLSLLKEVA